MTCTGIHEKKSAVSLLQRKGYDELININTPPPLQPRRGYGNRCCFSCYAAATHLPAPLRVSAQKRSNAQDGTCGCSLPFCWAKDVNSPRLFSQGGISFSRAPVSREHCPPASAGETSLIRESSSLPTRWEEEPRGISLCFNWRPFQFSRRL